MPPTLAPTSVGNIGRYRVLERIAAGGMGEVYRACTGIGGAEKQVALKLVRADVAADPGIAGMFVEEAKVALALSHTNVVQAFEVGRSEDRYFLAMEHVDGIDLGALIRLCRDRLGQPIPHRHAIYVAIEALKGLDYAHRCRDTEGRPLRLVHRDISPGNILLSREGEVKIADFGIAKTTLRATGSMAGSFKGKLLYMA